MIDVYYDIVVENCEEITQLTSCGILLIFNDSENIRCRLLGFGLANSPIKLAHLQAARLALAAINHKFRKNAVVIHTVDEQLTDLLAAPNDFQAATDELLRWCDNYPDLGFTIESVANENIAICRTLAKKICSTQQVYDSLTTDALPDG